MNLGILFLFFAALAPRDADRIRAVDAAYVHAVMTRDWPGLIDLLTPDCVVMPPNRAAVIGKDANLARYRAFNFTSVEYTHSALDVGGEGSVAYLQGTFTLKMTLPNVADPVVDRGKYLWVLKKQKSGKWLIDRIIWNTDVPKT